MKTKNPYAVKLGKLTPRALRRKYGKDYWKRIRRGEKPSLDTAQVSEGSLGAIA